MTAASQNRATQFIISMPLPVSLAKTNIEADIHYTELRRMFNATMKANMQTLPNVQCCENENLAGLSGSQTSNPVAGSGTTGNAIPLTGNGIPNGNGIILSAIHNPALTILRSDAGDSAELTAPQCTPMKKVNLIAKKDNPEDGKYILDNHQLTAAGMRKLARNWDNCLARLDRSSDGQLLLRRSSDSSESTGGSGWSEDNTRQSSGNAESSADAAAAVEVNEAAGHQAAAAGQEGQHDSITNRLDSASSSSSGGSRSTDSLEARPHWKPC